MNLNLEHLEMNCVSQSINHANLHIFQISRNNKILGLTLNKEMSLTEMNYAFNFIDASAKVLRLEVHVYLNVSKISRNKYPSTNKGIYARSLTELNFKQRNGGEMNHSWSTLPKLSHAKKSYMTVRVRPLTALNFYRMKDVRHLPKFYDL